MAGSSSDCGEHRAGALGWDCSGRLRDASTAVSLRRGHHTRERGPLAQSGMVAPSVVLRQAKFRIRCRVRTASPPMGCRASGAGGPGQNRLKWRRFSPAL
jgi:hypothetical protein